MRWMVQSGWGGLLLATALLAGCGEESRYAEFEGLYAIDQHQVTQDCSLSPEEWSAGELAGKYFRLADRWSFLCFTLCTTPASCAQSCDMGRMFQSKAGILVDDIVVAQRSETGCRFVREVSELVATEAGVEVRTEFQVWNPLPGQYSVCKPSDVTPDRLEYFTCQRREVLVGTSTD